MFLRSRILAALALLIIIGDSQAQVRRPGLDPPLVTDRLDITLDGYADVCASVTKVQIVMNGEENRVFPAQQDPKDACHWTATSSAGTFDPDLEHFSLRLGIGRTTCKHAKGDVTKRVGRLAFTIYKTDAREVVVSTDPPIAISYLRGVPAYPGDDPRSVACVERALFIGQPIPIPDVWFSQSALHPAVRDKRQNHHEPRLPTETLRLQLGRANSDPKYPGLIVNDEAVTRYLNGDNGSLDIKEIVAALGEERGKDQLSMPPLFSSNAYEADLKMLNGMATDKLMLKLVLTVK
jgi:hypothetical protein